MIHLTIICDGGSLNNGTPNSIGYGSFMVLAGDNKTGKLHQRQYGLGVTSSEAEYRAVISALEHVSAAFISAGTDLKTIQLTIRTDSLMVIGHICNNWKIKPHLIPLRNRTSELCDLFAQATFLKIPGDEMKQILGH